MRKSFISFILILLVFAGGVPAESGFSLKGVVQFDGHAEGKLIIRLFAVDAHPGITDIYDGSKALRSLSLEAIGDYSFDNLPPNHYIVTAFIDCDGDGALDFDPPEPFGWFQTGDSLLLARVDLRNGDVSEAKIRLRLPTPFDKKGGACEHGALRWMKGLPVLQLWGTAEERGYAHGFLAGKRIIDFFEFYILEYMVRSAKKYEEFYVPFFESRFNLPEEFEQELDAVIAGMKAAGTAMHVELLGRDFTRTDLLAINAYIERRAANPVEPVKADECTQFAFWGPLTVDGGLIAGRNMDGEIDIRKVTVSHFLTFVVEPSEPGRKRWISTMWPGFVGTISGINEDGLYSMENAGPTGPGQVAGGLVPCAWAERYALETLGADATPESVLATMNKFRCEGGGVTAAGSVILWAVPYNGQEAPAFIYEGDRNGGIMRTPAQVRPLNPYNIMGTNHYRVYGVDERGPGFNFGREIFCWRYVAGMAALEAWSRIGRKLGLVEMKQLLQIVASGSTEYAVIFLANEKKILIANDDLEADLWDAPHLRWAEFEFDELFNR
ncbi:MAG TPA: hypothetical protein VMX35_15090 [Acidobacteriota bacterium]|nr:hypothetical protein [Acidobacteriota bacterium]